MAAALALPRPSAGGAAPIQHTPRISEAVASSIMPARSFGPPQDQFEQLPPVARIRHRVMVAEQLTRQLQLVVEAQEGKISELRDSLAAASSEDLVGPRAQQIELLKESRRRRVNAEKESQPLEERIRRLTNEVRDAAAAHADLKRVNRRYQRMLSQAQASLSPHPRAASKGHAEHVSPTSDQLHLRPPHHGSGGGHGRHVTAVRDGSRCSLLSIVSSALWREQTPRGVLSWLLHGAEQVLRDCYGDFPFSVTLFVFDPWLCQSMSEVQTEAGNMLRFAAFELPGIPARGLAGCETQAYQRRGREVESPRFRTLQELPLVKPGLMVIPLQSTRRLPMVAALQIAICGSATPSSGRGASAAQDEEPEDNPDDLPQWLKGTLQLLCTTTVGILSLRRQVDMAEGVRGRVRDCLAITGALHGSDDLPAFELLVQKELSRFFGVQKVRLLFYDAVTKELVVAASAAPGGQNEGVAVGRRVVKRFPTRNGVVGRVVRLMEIMHVDPICRSVAISEQADDINLSEELARGNMLVGPMVCELPESTSREDLLLGIVQVVGKRRRTGFGAAELGKTTEEDETPGAGATKAFPPRRFVPFTAEDRYFFAQQCRILGLAAYRTMQVQGMASNSGRQAAPLQFNIEQLLT